MLGHIVFGLCVPAYSRTFVRMDVHDPVRLRSSTFPSVLAHRFKQKYNGLGVKS